MSDPHYNEGAPRSWGWDAVLSLSPLQMALAGGGLVALLLVAGVVGFFLSDALSGEGCAERLRAAQTDFAARTKALSAEIAVLKAEVAQKSDALKKEGAEAKRARDRMEELRAATVRAERALTDQRRKTQAFLNKLPEQCRKVDGAPPPLRPSNIPKARPGTEPGPQTPNGASTGPKAKPRLRPRR